MAAEFIDLDAATFEASYKEAQAVPEVAKLLKKDEAEVRIICEPKREPALTKEEIKKALLLKMKLEYEVEKRLQSMRVPS